MDDVQRNTDRTQRNDSSQEEHVDPERQAAFDSMNHDQLEQERARLEKAQGDMQHRIYRDEFLASLMKGVAVIALALLILCITLGFFIQNFIWFGITAAIILALALIFFKGLRAAAAGLREKKNRLRVECMAVYDRLDGKQQ